MAPSAEVIAQNVAQLTRRFPVLAELPESERIAVMKQATKHPSVWGPGIGVFVLLLPLLAKGVFYMQGTGFSVKTIALLGVALLFIVVPMVFRLQGRVISRIVAERTATR